MAHNVVAAYDVEIAVLLFAIFAGFVVGAAGSVSNPFAVGRPGE
jgi:hypothetical protein